MMPPIRAVLFDLGKVLFDFDFDLFFARVPDAMDRDPSLVTAMGELANQLESGALGPDDFFGELVSLLPELRNRQNAREAWCNIFTPIEENLHIVRQLAGRSDLRLGVISNTNDPHYQHVRRMTDVFGLFHHQSLSHIVGSMKPEEPIYHDALNGIGQPADFCLFFDDREENVRAAIKLGIHAVQVTEPGIVFDELSQRGLLA